MARFSSVIEQGRKKLPDTGWLGLAGFFGCWFWSVIGAEEWEGVAQDQAKNNVT
jgi:hypothetical protein